MRGRGPGRHPAWISARWWRRRWRCGASTGSWRACTRTAGCWSSRWTRKGGGRMDEADRRELERLLDLAEREQLMQFAPEVQTAEAVIEDRQEAADGLVLAANEVRQQR